PLLPVSVSVGASANPVCAGTSVTFTAIPTNGGTTPGYQWKVNGAFVSGATNATYVYIPVNTDAVVCLLTSNAICPTGSPATSNTVTMTVNTLLPVSVSVGASANPVCAGTSVTFTAIPTNGGTTPGYQWKVNGTIVSGATNATYSFIPVNSDAVVCVLTSNAICPTGSPATSNTVTMTVNPLLPVSVSIGASANPVCAGTSVIYTATPTNGGITPGYQWKVNGAFVSGATTSAYSYIPVNGDAIICVMTSSANCQTGSPATSNTVTMNVNALLVVGSISSDQSICPEMIPNPFIGTSPLNGTLPVYQWQSSINNSVFYNIDGATNQTFQPGILTTTTYFRMIQNASETCGGPLPTNTLIITVNPLLPVSVSIGASTNPVCAGTSVTYTATPTNGGTTPGYQWKVNGVIIAGATNATYSYVPVNSDMVVCVLTSNATCTTANPATSNMVTMTVNPLLTVSVTVGASANPVCAGTSVTFIATPTNGGSTPTYQWKVNGAVVSGATNSTYTYSPANSDAVVCVMTSNATCPSNSPATSNTVTMTVNPLLPVSVSVGASANPVCAGTSGTFTASPMNGGTTPGYQWKVNGVIVSGATNSTYSFIPLNNDAVLCVMTSNATCPTGSPATSNTVTMTVNPLLPVSVSVGASANPVCAGTSVTCLATPTNGGTTPTYQWKVNGVIVSGATNATYSFIPVNSDAITCVLTSNSICTTGNPATSSAVTMTVNPLLPVSVMVGASENPVCAGTSVTYTATPTNGGTTPGYQWKVNGTIVSGATNAVYSFIPVNSDAVVCVLTSDAICTTGNPASSSAVTMTVNPMLPVSVSVSASENLVCAGTSVTFNATATNGGTTPGYQWKVNGVTVSGATNAVYSFIPVNSDAVTCVLTSNAICTTGNPATSSTVTLTINPLLPVSVSVGSSANPVCAGTSVTFTATPTNGGTAPTYQWKANGVIVSGATNSTFSFIPLNNDAVLCVLTSNATCPTGSPATSNTVTMVVNPLLPVSVSVGASANPVCAGTSVTFTATPTNGGTTPTYQWKVNGTIVSGATTSTYSYIPVNTDAVVCLLTSNATCPTGSPATSNTVTMTVNPLLPVSVAVGASANPVCAGTSVTFTATPTNGGTTPTYQWKVNGAIVSGATNAVYSFIPVNSDAVTCILTSNAICPTGNPATSNTVTMTVNPLLPVSVSVGSSANPVCAGTSVTFTATPTNGGTAPTYQWKANGAIVSGATNAVYSFIPVNSDAVTCILTSNAICPTGNPATSSAVTMTVNPLLPVSVSVGASANPVCAGISVTLNATATNGGATPGYQWKVNGAPVSGATNAVYSFIPANSDAVVCVLTSNATCSTGSPATSNAVTMTVNPLLPVSVSVGASASPVCAGTSVTLNATATNGGTTPGYQWKVNGAPVSGATNAAYSYIPVNSDAVVCVLTSNAICPTGSPANSNTVTMTVNPLLPVSVSVDASANPVCAGTSVTFNATATNGGTTPVYQWTVNGTNISGATNSSFDFIPDNNNLINCLLTSNAGCKSGNPATSNTLWMTVNPWLPVSIRIAPSANPVCEGTLVTFAASPTNGGTAPVYQWQVNYSDVSEATNSTYTFTPSNGDIVTCTVTSSETCSIDNPAVSDVVTMMVNPFMPVGVTVTASPNPSCNGTLVVFTATPENGGTAPVYQWKVNEVNVAGATSATYAFRPENNDLISCQLTSNEACTTGNPTSSNTVTMTVNPLLPVSVTVDASANPVCAGTSVACTATPTNGGTTPGYQWKINGINVTGATNSSYEFLPVNGNKINCLLVSNAFCAAGNPATSNTLNMAVNPLLPVTLAITPSANPVLSGTLVTFTASAVNTGTTPLYSWKVNGIEVAGATTSSYSYIPADADVVSCIMLSNALCAVNNPAISNSILMSVSNVPSAILLQNMNITGTQCFDAVQTITVAGNGSTFTVQNSGHVTMIAGQKISYLPGTLVMPGGFMHGYITTTGQYCNNRTPSIPAVAENQEPAKVEDLQPFFKLYPNPTDGLFVLELYGSGPVENTRVEIFSMTGEKLFATDLTGGMKYHLSLTGKPAGIYLLHVISGKKSETTRIIKR
ncbi:MAG: T9SS type A sorting domain-containing protein, partial [Bacteroidetes bacterium]|nr:T9SS type A sorting domain-containing protein [Bacteroidota bacterium]